MLSFASPFMPIDLQNHQIIPLRKVPGLPFVRAAHQGKKPHVATVYRWVAPGVAGQKLEVTCVGGVTVTSVEAVLDFCERVRRTKHGGNLAAVMPVTQIKQIEAAEKRVRNATGTRSSPNRKHRRDGDTLGGGRQS